MEEKKLYTLTLKEGDTLIKEVSGTAVAYGVAVERDENTGEVNAALIGRGDLLKMILDKLNREVDGEAKAHGLDTEGLTSLAEFMREMKQKLAAETSGDDDN